MWWSLCWEVVKYDYCLRQFKLYIVWEWAVQLYIVWLPGIPYLVMFAIQFYFYSHNTCKSLNCRCKTLSCWTLTSFCCNWYTLHIVRVGQYFYIIAILAILRPAISISQTFQHFDNTAYAIYHRISPCNAHHYTAV